MPFSTVSENTSTSPILQISFFGNKKPRRNTGAIWGYHNLWEVCKGLCMLEISAILQIENL